MAQKQRDIYDKITASDGGRNPLRASVESAARVAMMDTPAAIVEKMDWEINGHREDAAAGEVSESILTLAAQIKEMNVVRAAQHLQEWLHEERRRSRYVTFDALLGHIWQKSSDPWQALCSLLAITRLTKPELIKGMSQSDLARLIHGDPKKRANFCAHERKLQKFMRSKGVKGFVGKGGHKSGESVKTFSAVQQGNNSRRKGERRKKARAFFSKQQNNKPEKAA